MLCMLNGNTSNLEKLLHAAKKNACMRSYFANVQWKHFFFTFTCHESK